MTTSGVPKPFGAQLKALREAAGYTQEELATVAGLSVHAVSALERGQRRRPHVETVRTLAAALDLTGAVRDGFVASARGRAGSTSPDGSGSSLPLAPTALLGREAEMTTLRNWLADSAVRLITLTGPGGVGKTRLALELAHTAPQAGATRAVFVSLAPVRDAAFVASAIAEALGMADVTAVDLPRRARAACQGRRTLLILDNFEQVLAGAPLIADLLVSVDTLRVLVTSRAPLRVRGEREYPVGPLELDAGLDAVSPGQLARTPAVRLFVERVRDVQPGFRLTSANGPTIAAICRRLDALPLALELAARWMKVLTAEDLLGRLTHDVLLSTVGARDLPERQQTMNATVAWSYQLLDRCEQRAFRRLGALPGPFPLDAAAEVLAGRDDTRRGSDEEVRATAALMDKSLLLRAETSAAATGPLYYMLDTVRAYAARELNASGERDDAMEGLVRFIAKEATLARKGLGGPAQVEWLNRTRQHLETYRGALAWLIERGRAEQAANIASGLMTFWAIRGHAAEGLSWCGRILQLQGTSPAAECRLLHGAALMYYTQGELEQTRAAAGRVRELARSIGEAGMVAVAENLLGHTELGAGNVDAARDQFTRSLHAFQSVRIPWGVGNSLSGLAAVAVQAGDSARAERLIEEALSTLRHGGPLYLALALCVRANLAVRRGRPDEAIAVVQESLRHIRDLQDKFAFVYALMPLAAAAVLKGDDAWAARILGARDTATERTGATVVDRSLDDRADLSESGVRARLGPRQWALAYTAGRRASIDALLEDIEGVLASSAQTVA